MKKPKTDIADHLKQVRILAHISQYAVSSGTGIDRSILSSIENGYIIPRPDEIEEIERFVSAAQHERVRCLKRVLEMTRQGTDRRGSDKGRSSRRDSAADVRLRKRGLDK